MIKAQLVLEGIKMNTRYKKIKNYEINFSFVSMEQTSCAQSTKKKLYIL